MQASSSRVTRDGSLVIPRAAKIRAYPIAIGGDRSIEARLLVCSFATARGLPSPLRDGAASAQVIDSPKQETILNSGRRREAFLGPQLSLCLSVGYVAQASDQISLIRLR